MLEAINILPTSNNEILSKIHLTVSKSYPYGLFHRSTSGTKYHRCGSLEAEPDKRILFQDLRSEYSQEEK